METSTSHNPLKQAIAEIATMPRETLLERWQTIYEQPAPHKCRLELLRQACAWHLQAQVLGRLTATDVRRLKHRRRIAFPPSGAQLVRVWQGQTHQVTILEDGFAYAGRQWRSLSAIAKAITGTAWNGPQFFGLRLKEDA